MAIARSKVLMLLSNLRNLFSVLGGLAQLCQLAASLRSPEVIRFNQISGRSERFYTDLGKGPGQFYRRRFPNHPQLQAPQCELRSVSPGRLVLAGVIFLAWVERDRGAVQTGV